MTGHLDIQTIARTMGGDVAGGAALVPGPGHKACDRSLSIKVSPNAPDGLLVHSFAGDDPIHCKDYVRSKLGLPAWEPKASSKINGSNGHYRSTPKPAIRTNKPAQFPTWTASGADGKPHFYNWNDEGPPKRDGELRRHVYIRDGMSVRIKVKNAPGGGPLFVNWYRVTNPRGVIGWQAKKPTGYRSVPYIGAVNPFDEELSGDLIFWTEGEKDSDTLGKHNAPAFTFGGCGDGLPEDIGDYLAARHLVILADNDDAGRKHAEEKAAVARAAVAASIKIVHFRELPEHGDLSDFVAGGGTVADFMERVDSVPEWQPAPSIQPADNSTKSSGSNWRRGALLASDLQSMTFAPVRYVLPGYIPEGITILAGKPKIGKSWLTLDLCIAVAGGRFTLGTFKPPQGDVLYLALEDNPRRLKRRLAKLLPGIDSQWPTRLTLQTEWRRADAGGLADIEEWCGTVPAPTLIVVDTLEKIRPLISGKMQAYSADYHAIEGLQKIAGARGISVVINHHVRKMEADDPFDTISGTLGLTGAADTILVLKRQSGGMTLHARGRDIEESETALQFDRSACRWSILGAAADVHRSNERAAIIKALRDAGDDGLAVSEILAATEGQSRGAIDTLLFKMKEAGEIVRQKRGIYAIGKDAGKIGQKERNGGQITANIQETCDLTNLTDLSGGENWGSHSELRGEL